MFSNFSSYLGVIAVIIIMVVVLFLFATIGKKEDAKEKAKIKKRHMKEAAKMNFNTVEEYENYLADKEAQSKIEKQALKAEKKAAAKEKAKLKKEKKAEVASNRAKEKAEKNIGKDLPKEDVADVAENQDVKNVFDGNVNALAEEINTSDIENLIAQKHSNEDAVDTSPVQVTAKLTKSAIDGNSDEMENTVVINKTDLKVSSEENAEETIPEHKQKKGFLGRKKDKKEASADLEQAVDLGNGEKLDLDDLQKIISSKEDDDADTLKVEGPEALKDTEKEEVTERKESVFDGPAVKPVNRPLPEANPYVQSIPRILNTKEAIAVSEKAPKVTTFYPDGKVVRDNRLVTKRSFYREENNNDAESKENEEILADNVDSVVLSSKQDEQANDINNTEGSATKEIKNNEEKSEMAKKPEVITEAPVEEVEDTSSDEKNEAEIPEAVEASTEQNAENQIDEDNSLDLDLIIGAGQDIDAEAVLKEDDLENLDKAEQKVEQNDSDNDENGDVAEVRKSLAEDAMEKFQHSILMPEKPQSFGYKVAWLAIPNIGNTEVLKALGLKNISPANWTKGLECAYDGEELFVSPNVNGWTFVIGRSLWKKIDINLSIEKNVWLQKLADSFREVYYFTTDETGNNGWLYIKDGLLIRAYGYSGELDEVMWNFGPHSKEEHHIIQGFSMGKTKVVPTEKDVLALAAAWSVDTTFTNINTRPDIGFTGNF